METTLTECVEKTVNVDLYQHWLGDRWIFIAEVTDEKGKKKVYDAFLNLDAQIVLTAARYCDGRDHAWFRLKVQHVGNCHHCDYLEDWNKAVRAHMMSNKMSHCGTTHQSKLSGAFTGLDNMKIIFG